MSDHENNAGSEGMAPTEWIAAIVGALLVCAAAVYLGIVAFTRESTPASVSFTTDAAVRTASGYLVRVTANNSGTQTASHLVVEGRLNNPAGVERAEVVLDYLPARSSRKLAFIFTGDPARGELTVRAVAYEEP